MPFDATSMPQYIDQLLAEADLTPEVREALRKAAADEKVAKKANELAVPRPDYSRTLDEQRSKQDQERELWTKEKGEYRAWYEKQQERLAKWEEEHGNNGGGGGGNGNGDSQPRDGQGRYLSASDVDRMRSELKAEIARDLDKRFETQGEAVLGVTEDYISLATDYQSRFGKRLPVEEVRKKAIDEGTNLRVAYERFIQPEVDKQRETEFNAKLQAAREEGARDALSRMSNPAHPGNLDGHPVFGHRELPADYSKMTPEAREAASMAAFEKHWEQTSGFTKPATN